jgi:putative transposase
MQFTGTQHASTKEDELLSDAEFVAYCNRLGFPSPTVELLKKIRSSPPSRRVGGGRQSVSGFYSSSKNGFGVQFESHTVEFHLVYKLEHDPDVLEYHCQPRPPIQLRYLGLSGKLVVVWHTPDYFVLRRDRVGWIECKDKDKLPELEEISPNRYRLVGNRWESPAGRDYAEPLSLCYEIHSSADIDPTFVRNAQFLDDYWRLTDPVSPASSEAILKCLARSPTITLECLLAEVKDTVPLDDLYQLLAKKIIHFDWSAAPIVEPARVHVFADAAAATQFNAAANRDAVSTGLINLRVNGQLDWDGKPWKILNVGNHNVSLLAGDEFVDLPAIVVEKLIREGRLHYSSEQEQGQPEHPMVQTLLSQASPQDLAIASTRAERAQGHISGDSAGHSGSLSRKDRRDIAKFKEAQHLYGNGFVGLLPRTKLKGNRTLYLDQSVADAMTESIEKKYLVPEQPTIISCWEGFKKELEAKNLACPSYKTYWKAIQKVSQHRRTLGRKGRRAAYSTSEFYWTLERKTPPHGDRPFEIGHIDHTELDVELVSALTGKNLRRVWLTLLIDAFSRRVLGFYLTFDEPSYRSCMMVLRECVRRHQRLPQILVVDGGPEFRSTYFDQIIARYEKTKKTRPAAQARFGSVCERLFGTANTQLIHSLRGNTQITKNVRQVTKFNNPQNLAVWDFKSLDETLKEFLYEVYDTNRHPALGMSPRNAYVLGMQGSPRLKSLIAYNQDFLMTTAPSTQKGTAKVYPGRGVTINYFLYWSEAFRDPRVEGRNVPVRYDPWNAAIAWAYVQGQWVKCHSQYYGILEGRSEKEIQIATKLLRDQMKSHGQHRMTITASKLASFLDKTKQHESLLIQRQRDIEAGYTRDPDSATGEASRIAVDQVLADIEEKNGPSVPSPTSALKPKRKIVVYGDL